MRVYAHTNPAIKKLYFAVRRVKRAILFKNPVLDFTQILCIDQPLPQGPESLHEAIHRMGIMAVQAFPLGKGRMLTVFGIIGQLFMTGKTELPPCFFMEKLLGLFTLMRIMATAALPGSKGLVQAETVELLIKIVMTIGTELPLGFGQGITLR